MKKNVEAIMAMEMIQKEMAQQSCGGKKASLGSETGFVDDMAGWAYILYEIFLGEAGGVAGNCSEAVKDAFSYMRIIVTAGWSVYPLGYYYGYLLGAVDETLLNVVYNVADFVNKIAFVLACWSAAKAESEGKGDELLG